MRKIVLTMLLLGVITIAFSETRVTPAWAFLNEVTVLTKEEVGKLSDTELVDVYTAAVIERKASETFHARAGFTPKEYDAFKDLLGFIVRLRQEMITRNVEAPPVDEWLK